jgi:hypothetical protein
VFAAHELGAGAARLLDMSAKPDRTVRVMNFATPLLKIRIFGLMVLLHKVNQNEAQLIDCAACALSIR